MQLAYKPVCNSFVNGNKVQRELLCSNEHLCEKVFVIVKLFKVFLKGY